MPKKQNGAAAVALCLLLMLSSPTGAQGPARTSKDSERRGEVPAALRRQQQHIWRKGQQQPLRPAPPRRCNTARRPRRETGEHLSHLAQRAPRDARGLRRRTALRRHVSRSFDARPRAMSFLWIILVQWAVVLHVPTGTTYTIILVQWVCLSKFHEWWEFEVPRYREELKTRYGKVLSHNVYFLSLFEYFANSFLSLLPLWLRQMWAPTPEEVLREADADDDDYEAPGWVTSAVYEIPRPGLGWLWSATYIGLYVLTMWASVGFYAALWGGGARGSLAQLLLVAMTWANQGRTISGGKTTFMTRNLLAMIPWQPVVGLHRLSEKVEDDAVVPSEPISTYSRWSLALRVFYSLVIGLLVYFAYARFDVSMGGVVAVFVALAVGKAVLLWNDDNYKLETALAVQPSPETKCYRAEAKCREEGKSASVNQKEKERQTETGVLAFDFVARHQLDPRPARLGLVALFAVLGAVVGAALFGRIGFGALAGFVLGGGVGFINFGPKQGVPMVYVVDTRILQLLVDYGIWHLVADETADRMDINTVRFLNQDPPPVDDKSEWANLQGHAIVVVADDELRLFKCKPLSVLNMYGNACHCHWKQLKPSYSLVTVSAAHLDRAMRLRLFQDGADAGPLLPPGTIRVVPINEFARAARAVIESSNEVATWPREGPVQIDLREPHEPVTFGVAQMKARGATARTRHQVAIARVLRLLEDGAVDYFRVSLGVVLSFVCVVVAAWACGPVAAGATACACVLLLSCVLVGITGASVDMLSECKHSVTVKYWRGPRGMFFPLLRVALVLAILCGVRRGADLFWWVLLGGLFSLVIGLSLGLFGALVSLPIAVAGCGSGDGLWEMTIETARKQYAEIVVGACAAAVFVFFRVYECGDVVEVRLDDGSWVLGCIVKVYAGDGKRETTYDIASLDEGYDRRDFFVDLEGFEFPDPPLPFAVGAAVVDLEDGRKGRIVPRPYRFPYQRVQFPYVEEPQSVRPASLRVIPEAQAAPPVVQPVNTTLLRGITATLADGAPRIRSTGGKQDIIYSVLDTTNQDLNRALCKLFKSSRVVREAFEDVDAPNRTDFWSSGAGRGTGGNSSELAKELQEKVNRSFCTGGNLPKMLMKKLAAHQYLLEKLYRQSPLELAKAKAPPPGSSVAVHFTDGRDYEAIVTEVNDTRATVQFNNGETMPLTFPDPDVRVTHVEPPPPVRQGRGQKRKSDDDESDDEPPPKRARQGQSKKRGSSGSGDEPAPKRRHTSSEDPDHDEDWE